MLKSPFPWFGGKSKVAHLVWERFGNPGNYCEPFFGSGAVLLMRPTEPKTETVNDLDCYIANFWRALQAQPDEVARWADWPINETDLTARHQWLVNQVDFQERMKADPDYFDAKIAGWWVWGISQWIGSGWCEGRKKVKRQRPQLTSYPNIYTKRPSLGVYGKGVHRQLPQLRNAGEGIHRSTSRNNLYDYMQALADRLRYVRVCCGDWSRILTPSPTFKLGLTGVFLDPPYNQDLRDKGTYTTDTAGLSDAVREWAIANGDNPLLRIALCGYAGEHKMPPDWDCIAWKANGGYGNQGQGRGRDNTHLECIWFSPHCLKPLQAALF